VKHMEPLKRKTFFVQLLILRRNQAEGIKLSSDSGERAAFSTQGEVCCAMHVVCYEKLYGLLKPCAGSNDPTVYRYIDTDTVYRYIDTDTVYRYIDIGTVYRYIDTDTVYRYIDALKESN